MSFEQWIQSRLTAHGFPCGVIDGVLGPKTTAALRAFQRSVGLEQTGVADQDTVAALRQSASERHERPAGESRQPRVISSWPAMTQAASFYGEVGTRQVTLELPYPMKLAWDLRRTVERITVHELVAASAARALRQIAQSYSPEQRRELGIDIFGGSLNVRRMRGGSAWSMHSWGIALDFDPERNQLKWGRDRARLAQPDAEPFWRAWEAEGWVSLGRELNYDWMHVQAARLP